MRESCIISSTPFWFGRTRFRDTIPDKDGKISEAEFVVLWKDSADCREASAILTMRFGDTDVDKDGKINAA